MWNYPAGHAKDAGHDPRVTINTFGGEGTGVQAIVKSTTKDGLGWWNVNDRLFFHVQSEPEKSSKNGTVIHLHIKKPDGKGWVYYGSQVRYDKMGSKRVGLMVGLNSFLEDYGLNRQYRQGVIHGAWYKSSNDDSEWKTVTKVHSDHNKGEDSSNMYTIKMRPKGSLYQELIYATGGTTRDKYNTSGKNVQYIGNIRFKKPPKD